MYNNEESTYQSYLLRLWRDSEHSPWRAALQSTATEQIYQFGDVGQMLAFLVAQLVVDVDANITPYDETTDDAP